MFTDLPESLPCLQLHSTRFAAQKRLYLTLFGISKQQSFLIYQGNWLQTKFTDLTASVIGFRFTSEDCEIGEICMIKPDGTYTRGDGEIAIL